MGNTYSVDKKELKYSKSLPNSPALKRWLNEICFSSVFVTHLYKCKSRYRSGPATTQHTSIPVPATALVQRRCAPDKVRPLPPTPNQCTLHTNTPLNKLVLKCILIVCNIFTCNFIKN